MRKLVIILIALVAVAALVYFGGQRLLAPRQAEPTPVAVGDSSGRTSQVRATGRVVPVRWQALHFATSGVVDKVNVKEGAQVKAGDVLAELKADDSAAGVRPAELRLAAAQAQLAQAQATPEPYKLNTAKAQLAAAQAHLAALQAGPTAAELETAQLRLEQARLSLWSAQANRDAVAGRPEPGAALDQAKASVASAEIGVRLAEISLEQFKAGPTAEELANAQVGLAQAESALATLQAGPTAESLATLKGNVEEAQLALDQVKAGAKRAQEERRIVAPYDGTVSTVSLVPGQSAGPSSDALTIADLSDLQIEALDLTELDIASIKLEQAVEVVLPGYGSPILAGRVSYIAPQATIAANGAATYRVLITLTRKDVGARWGMSANLTFGVRAR